MGVFGLVCRRLTRSPAAVRLHSRVAVARATLPSHSLEQPRFPPAFYGRLPQVFGGRACSSNGVPPQSSNGITPKSNGMTPQSSNGITPQSSNVMSKALPSPAALLPKGYGEDLEKLSSGIADIESDFKFLFHLIWVLYGLVFAVLLKIPGTAGDVDGKTSDLEAGLEVVVEQSNCIKRDQTILEDDVLKRNAKKVSSQTTPTP